MKMLRIYKQSDRIDHALRSEEVAREYLNNHIIEGNVKSIVLDCIKNHHNGRQDKSLEAQLFSDADGLDFLGIVGLLRDFSTKDREMRKSLETSIARIERIPTILILEKSKEIAKRRIQKMMFIIEVFEEETYGFY